MGTLSNALAKDPYGPEPTYKLAVAYALLGRKSCSLALLERLKGLAGMPDVEKEASRTIQRAVARSRVPAVQQGSSHRAGDVTCRGRDPCDG